MTVKKGVTFYATYADGNCLWHVIKSIGEGVWLCRIDAKEFDYAGVEKPFFTKDIERSIKQYAAFDSITSEHDKFYSELQPGQTVHYHTGFDNWVRCEAVSVDGKMQLKPIALVGAWHSGDLPSRQRNGSIYRGYYAKMIDEGKVFEPNVTNLWEFGRLGRQTNPENLTPISLEVREQTPEEKFVSQKWLLLDQIGDIARDAHGSEQPYDALAMIISLIVGNLNWPFDCPPLLGETGIKLDKIPE